MGRGTQGLNLFPEFGCLCTCPEGGRGVEGGKSSSPQRRTRANRRCLVPGMLLVVLWPRCVLKTTLWKHCQSSPECQPLEPAAQMFPETPMSLNNWPEYQGREQLVSPKPSGTGRGLQRTKVSVETQQINLKASSGTSAWQLKIKSLSLGQARWYKVQALIAAFRNLS